MIIKSSPHSVAITVDRLEAELKAKGIAIVVRWDHAAAAAQVGMALRPMQVLIFGNPRLGTPLMQANPQIGLDLPVRALVWEDEAGRGWVGYTAPAELAARYQVGDRADVVQTLSDVLDQLTTTAIQP